MRDAILFRTSHPDERVVFLREFAAKDVDGKEAKVLLLSQGQNYADGCLRDVMKDGHGSVSLLHCTTMTY